MLTHVSTPVPDCLHLSASEQPKGLRGKPAVIRDRFLLTWTPVPSYPFLFVQSCPELDQLLPDLFTAGGRIQPAVLCLYSPSCRNPGSIT